MSTSTGTATGPSPVPSGSNPASVQTPLPVSAAQVRAYLGGLDAYLGDVARQRFPIAATANAAVSSYLASLIRDAQERLENLSGTKFFVTRFATEEWASQAGLILGSTGSSGYDEIVQALPYDVQAWRLNTGRTELSWSPVKAPITAFVLSLQGSAKIAQIPSEWCNVDATRGIVHLMPQAVTDLSITYFNLFATNPILVRPGTRDYVPLLVHVQYTAGLCERTASDGLSPYDPEEENKNTRWNQNRLVLFQNNICLLAASRAMRAIAPRINRGGVSLSIDGVSRRANSGEMTQLAMQYEKDALAYGQTGAGSGNGNAGRWQFV